MSPPKQRNRELERERVMRTIDRQVRKGGPRHIGELMPLVLARLAGIEEHELEPRNKRPGSDESDGDSPGYCQALDTSGVPAAVASSR